MHVLLLLQYMCSAFDMVLDEKYFQTINYTPFINDVDDDNDVLLLLSMNGWKWKWYVCTIWNESMQKLMHNKKLYEGDLGISGPRKNLDAVSLYYSD